MYSTVHALRKNKYCNEPCNSQRSENLESYHLYSMHCICRVHQSILLSRKKAGMLYIKLNYKKKYICIKILPQIHKDLEKPKILRATVNSPLNEKFKRPAWSLVPPRSIPCRRRLRAGGPSACGPAAPPRSSPSTGSTQRIQTTGSPP